MGSGASTTTKAKVTAMKEVEQKKRGTSERELEREIEANDPVKFAQVLREVAGTEFAKKVAKAIQEKNPERSKEKELAVREPAVITITAAVGSSSGGNSSEGKKPAEATEQTRQESGAMETTTAQPREIQTGRRRAGREGREMAKIRGLAHETYFSCRELEGLIQEFRDLAGGDRVDETHARMFFTQHGFTERLRELIVESIVKPVLRRKEEEEEEEEEEIVTECIKVLSALEKGTSEERMMTYYRLFDENKDGQLEASELRILGDVMVEQFERASGRTRDEKATAAIESLLMSIVSEIGEGEKGRGRGKGRGIPLTEILFHEKLVHLWELLRIL